MIRFISALLVTLFAVIVGSSPGPLAAQRVAPTPVFLAIPETFPEVEARAVLMREPDRDIVILPRDGVDPETLHVALSVLERMRPQELRDTLRRFVFFAK